MNIYSCFLLCSFFLLSTLSDILFQYVTDVKTFQIDINKEIIYCSLISIIISYLSKYFRYVLFGGTWVIISSIHLFSNSDISNITKSWGALSIQYNRYCVMWHLASHLNEYDTATIYFPILGLISNFAYIMQWRLISVIDILLPYTHCNTLYGLAIMFYTVAAFLSIWIYHKYPKRYEGYISFRKRGAMTFGISTCSYLCTVLSEKFIQSLFETDFIPYASIYSNYLNAVGLGITIALYVLNSNVWKILKYYQHALIAPICIFVCNVLLYGYIEWGPQENNKSLHNVANATMVLLRGLHYMIVDSSKEHLFIPLHHKARDVLKCLEILSIIAAYSLADLLAPWAIFFVFIAWGLLIWRSNIRFKKDVEFIDCVCQCDQISDNAHVML